MNTEHSDILKELKEMLTVKDGRVCSYEVTTDMQLFLINNRDKIMDYMERRLKKENKKVG